MKFLATIIDGFNRTSRMFTDEEKAKQWLDETNNNLECQTTIEQFDDDWNKINSYIYTEGNQ